MSGLRRIGVVTVAADPWRFGEIPTVNKVAQRLMPGPEQLLTARRRQGLRLFGPDLQDVRVGGRVVPVGQSGDMKNAIPRVDKSQIQVGDLLVKYGHVAMYLGDGNGDGVASVLEARPRWGNPDGSTAGVMISDAWEYMSSGEYTAHRVTWA
jgi:hypothetical protein